MSGYIQTELVECNRLRSQEALSGNDDNPASWTNTLSAIYDLEAGDKVSLYNAFISERGAGNAKTIEIKGQSLGKFRDFNYIEEKIVRQAKRNTPISSDITEKDETIELRDNEVNMLISFYKSMNGTGYVTLPRRFMSLEDTGTAIGTSSHHATKYAFTTTDSSATGYIYPIPNSLFVIKGDYFKECVSEKDKVVNDNSNFTLYASTRKLGTNPAEPLDFGDDPITYTIAPEYKNYVKYKNKVKLSVPTGFNSAQFIADDLTRQLRKITETNELIFTENPNLGGHLNAGPDKVVSKTVESSTYKTFNCMTQLLFGEDQYDLLIGDQLSTWYNNFNIIGLKRPELYDTGKEINMTPDFKNEVFKYEAGAGSTGHTIVMKEKAGQPDNVDLSRYALVTVEALGKIKGPAPAPIIAWNQVGGNPPLINLTMGSSYVAAGIAEGDEIIITFYYKLSEFPLQTKTNGLLGTFLLENYDYSVADAPMKLAIPYTKDNLLKLKNFINAQEEYPEIWDSWNKGTIGLDPVGNWTYGNGKYYSISDTVDNTRFMHMNVERNSRVTEVEPTIQTQPDATYSPAVHGSNASGSFTINIYWDGTEADKIRFNEYYYVKVVGNAFDINTQVLSVEYTSAPTVFGTLRISNPLTGVRNSGNVDIEFYYIAADQDQTTFNRESIPITTLGSSCYRNTYTSYRNDLKTETEQEEFRYSKLLLFKYDKENRDVYYDNPSLKLNKLTYGCFGKTSYTQNGYTIDYVTIFPNSRAVGGEFPVEWFDAGYLGVVTSDPAPDSRVPFGFIEGGRKIGYDMHFTAAAQPAISLYNGKAATFANYYGTQFPKTFLNDQWGKTVSEAASRFSAGVQPEGAPAAPTPDNTGQLAAYINRRYVGADNPRINWDGEHFNISDLHTPENLAARGPDGGTYGVFQEAQFYYLTSDPPTNAGDIIYKINPAADINEFCPALSPYIGQFGIYTKNGSTSTTDKGAGKIMKELFNTNINPYTIYDSKSGIVFEDMGFDEDTWNESLWGTLGFTYEQFHSTINNRLERVDDNNVTNLKYPSTNAQIVTTDTKLWNTNDDGVPLYSDNLPCPFALFYYNGNGVALDNFVGSAQPYMQIFPPINQKTTSVELTAQKFPVSMIKGYYTIRSNIVPQSIFVGGSSNITNMPIVGIIDKMNPQNDYYFGSETGVDFVIGGPTKMSSITCSIHDPDGSYANVDNSSSIIFKISRQVRTSFNIIEEILADEKTNKKSKL